MRYLTVGRFARSHARCCVTSDAQERADLAEILGRCRYGDALAWEALVRQFQSRVYGIAFHYVGDAEDARDLAQEIFVRVYRRLDSCADEHMFLPWLVRISRNACIDFLRRRKGRPVAAECSEEDLARSRAPGLNPEEHCAADFRSRLIYRAFRRLTALNREVILLREILELPLEQIAGLLSIPLGTVKSRISRARVELAQRVTALGLQPDDSG
ncbi:MAG: sigma-70 family RNA polymerase sigma factor [Acidobacteria bacterium]|nr:sigma-70 family RNA polymerase sigma factor [Acidobacteriota bacterium]